MENKICPKCKRKVIKDKVGNWFTNEFGMLISHNMECDNNYLEDQMENELTAQQEDLLLESDREKKREIEEANHKAAEEIKMKSLPKAQELINQVEEVERRRL